MRLWLGYVMSCDLGGQLAGLILYVAVQIFILVMTSHWLLSSICSTKCRRFRNIL